MLYTPRELASIANAMATAIGNMNNFTLRFTQMEGVMNAQSDAIMSLSSRLESIEKNGGSNSGSEYTRKQKSKVGGKARSKLDRVEFERDRSHKVLMEKLESRNKAKKTSDSEEGDEEGSSEEEVNMGSLRKKLSRKQNVAVGLKVSSRLSQAGGSFPEDESSESSGSGTDSCKLKCHRSKNVKSGAKLRKRPVKKTELWPHTIANEEDDGDITHETIPQGKFLKCFAYIMNNCEKSESAGRAAFLEAITSILEYLPWSEARTFHNIVMTKIEQERMDWKSDFTLEADLFIEKKVRANLRPKTFSSGYERNNNRGNYFYRGYGRGTSSNSTRGQGQARGNNPLYSFICRQWNYDTCSYGSRCKRWHTCWSCAGNGKVGEPHKASSHGNSTPRSGQGQNEQRV